MVLIKDPGPPPAPPPPDPGKDKPQLTDYKRNYDLVASPATGLRYVIAAAASTGGLLVTHWFGKVIFHTVFQKPASFFGRVFAHFMPNPKKAERTLELAIGHYLGAIFTGNSPAIARWLRHEAEIVERTTGILSSLAEWTYQALYQLRHVTVPHLIYNATKPLIAAVNGLDARLSSVETKLADSTAEINRMLRRLPWGTGVTFPLAIGHWADAFAQLYNDWYDDWRKKLYTLWYTRVPDLELQVKQIAADLYGRGQGSLDAIRRRLRELEDAFYPIYNNPLPWLGAFMLTASGVAALTRWLTNAGSPPACDNTKTFGEQLCAAPAGTGTNWANILGDLAALALGFEFLLDPKAVVHAAQETEGILATGFEWMAGVGSVSLGEAEAAVEAGIVDLFGL